MFKKAFRILNIALTSKEIDLLLNYCQLQSESLIDWKQFIKKLQLHEDKQKIRTRMQPKIQHISDLLHYYMISPKDAFRKVITWLFSGTTLEQDTYLLKNSIKWWKNSISKPLNLCQNSNNFKTSSGLLISVKIISLTSKNSLKFLETATLQTS